MVKSADRVLHILETVGLDREGITHGELSARLRIPKSSLTLLLGTLLARGYLATNGGDRRYRLGPHVLVLAARYLNGLDLVDLGHPVIRKLTRALDESSEIAIQKGDEIMVICKEDCSRPLGRIIQLGDRAPMYATAAGKVILAHLPEDEIKRYLSTRRLTPITKRTMTDPQALEREFRAIRSGGIGRCREELQEGITAIACPVFDLYGRVAASIVLPVPTIRFSGAKEKKAEKMLLSAAQDLSHQLGFDPHSKKVAGRPLRTRE
jgi:IclR family KDG regulon transcriptional repressor